VSIQAEQATLGSMNVWDAKTNPPELTHHRRRDPGGVRCACCSPRGTSSSSEESPYSRSMAA
jgi:hypothetical protein